MKKVLLLSFAFCLLFWNVEAQEHKVVINKGSRYTRSPIVSLQIAAYDAIKMRISNYPDFREANWIAYDAKIYGWALINQQGEQKVYVKFKNKDGKESETINDVIILDSESPKNVSMKIDVPNGTIKDTAQIVNLKFAAEDASYMMISNNKAFFRGRWQMFANEEKEWKLSKNTNDGVKMVFAKFRDRAGNVSEVVFDKVTLDTQSPVRSAISINGGVDFTRDSSGVFKVTIISVGSNQMRISYDSTFKDVDWIPISANVNMNYTVKDGYYKIYAQFKDNAGNVSEVVSDDIHVDVTAPMNGSITINDGDEVTRHLDAFVQLDLKADGATMYMISNTKDFKGARWIPYDPALMPITDWQLTGNNGEKIVYVKFKDDVDNESPIYSDTIVLIR